MANTGRLFILSTCFRKSSLSLLERLLELKDIAV